MNSKFILGSVYVGLILLAGCTAPYSDGAEKLSREGKHAEALAVYKSGFDKAGPETQKDPQKIFDLARYEHSAGNSKDALQHALRSLALAKGRATDLSDNPNAENMYAFTVALLIEGSQLDAAEKLATEGLQYVDPKLYYEVYLKDEATRNGWAVGEPPFWGDNQPRWVLQFYRGLREAKEESRGIQRFCKVKSNIRRV